MASVRKVTPTAPAKKPVTKAAVSKPVGNITGRVSGATKTAPVAKAPVARATTTTRKTTATRTTTSRATKVSGDKIAVFIDLDNTGANLTNVQEVISILKNSGTITYGKLYGYTDERADEFEETVRENKFSTAGKLRLKDNGMNVMDIRLVVDAMNMTAKNTFDSIFIWLGNGDLISLFAHFQEIGLKTLTPDLPSVDCKNKFVTTAVKLYSAHTVIDAKPVQSAAVTHLPPSTTVTIQPVPQVFPQSAVEKAIMEESPVPVLPRKSGAPGFGEREPEPKDPSEVEVEEDREMTEEEMSIYLKTIALQAIISPNANTNATDDLPEIKQIKYDDDFGGLQNTTKGAEPDDVSEDTKESADEPAAPVIKPVMDDIADVTVPVQEYKKPVDFGYDIGDDKALKELPIESDDDNNDGFTDFGDDFGDLIKR